MRTDRFILDGKRVVPCDDVFEWGRWFEKAERHVADTESGGIRVSTVFMGLNHSWGPGPPLLFETMIFGGDHDDHQERCSTWEEAEAMHAKACELVFGPYAPLVRIE